MGRRWTALGQASWRLENNMILFFFAALGLLLSVQAFLGLHALIVKIDMA